MGLAKSVQEVVAATLSNLGLAVPANIVQIMLLKDGYFSRLQIPLRWRLCDYAGWRQYHRILR